MESNEQATTLHAAAQVIADAMVVYERGDLDELAAFVHPEAEIEMFFLGRGAAKGPDGLRQALEQARGTVHRPTMSSLETLGSDAVLMIGRIQHETPGGGISDRKAVWLSILRDGLLWRTLVFTSETEARAAYEALEADTAGGAPQRPSV